MRHTRFLRGGPKVILSGLALGFAGCTHNYYYGNAVPPCAPTTVVPGSVSSGPVCDVPTRVSGGNVLAQGAGRSTIVSSVPMSSSETPPRVVVSAPRSNSLFGWRRVDPEASLFTTKVEGALDEPTATR